MRNGEKTKMNEQVVLREFQTSDRPILANIVRETWQYDRFCSPKTAAKMAKLYLNSCLINQTFTRVLEVDGIPAGIIMGKDIQHHKCSLSLRIMWLCSVISLLISKEGREISKIFNCVESVDKELISHCEKDYKGEVAFFVVDKKYRGKGMGRKLFQTVVDYMQSQRISEFFLFTDTSCNYRFYEHFGMKQCSEKTKEINIHGEKEDMTFFIYKYQMD